MNRSEIFYARMFLNTNVDPNDLAELQRYITISAMELSRIIKTKSVIEEYEKLIHDTKVSDMQEFAERSITKFEYAAYAVKTNNMMFSFSDIDEFLYCLVEATMWRTYIYKLENIKQILTYDLVSTFNMISWINVMKKFTIGYVPATHVKFVDEASINNFYADLKK